MCPFMDVSSSLADPRDPTLEAQLNHEIQQYRSQLFAESTKATYRTHRNTYLRFCNYMGYTPVPLHPAHLLHYAAFLARSLKPSSISGYLNIIGILHKEFGLPNPLLDNWPLKSLLTGIKRAIGTRHLSKNYPLPPLCFCVCMALSILLIVLIPLFWAICLVAFYGPFRKSHLLPMSAQKFDPSKQLTKCDFKFFLLGNARHYSMEQNSSVQGKGG